MTDNALPLKKEKRSKSDKIIMNFNTGYLECYLCGRWFDFNKKILPAPIDWAGAVTEAFGRLHKKCRQTEQGKKLEAASTELHQHVLELKKEAGVGPQDAFPMASQHLYSSKIKDYMQKLEPYSFRYGH